MTKFLYFFENIFSKYQTGFRKGFTPQSCLIVMKEKFQKSLDQGSEYAAWLTDLFKLFDYLPHDLIIAKLHAKGFVKTSLRLKAKVHYAISHIWFVILAWGMKKNIA